MQLLMNARMPTTPLHPLRRLPRNLAVGAVSLAALLLALAWLLPIDPLAVPDGAAPWELLAVRIDALRFLLGLGVAACALLLLLLRCPRFAAVGAGIVLWAVLPAWIPAAAPRATQPGAPVLRVLSVNLAKAEASTARVVEEVLASRADLVFLQEYTPRRQQELQQRLGDVYTHRHGRARTDAFGMAVYSKRPLHDATHFVFEASGTPQLRVVVKHGAQRLVLYGIHLVPIWGPLYVKHRREFIDLLERIRRETMPTALVGDFNLVDHGALASVLHEHGFLDAHALAGESLAASWPVNGWLRHVPGIRIDHVYLGRGLTAREAWVCGHTGSDHLPIGAAITATRR